MIHNGIPPGYGIPARDPSSRGDGGITWRPSDGFLCSIGIALLLLMTTAAGEEIVVEPTHATIETKEGQRLLVVFATEDRPALTLKPKGGAWDWSRESRLVIPVENPDDEALTLRLHVEDQTRRPLTGKVAIAPRSSGNLAISISAPPPMSMGMIAGPSLATAGLDPGTLPVTATDGSIDAAEVALVRLGLLHPSSPRPLVVGPLHVEPDHSSYDGIVDGFGQFLPGEWPEKVSSVEMLRAKGDEEERALAQWLADLPKRDRFGGFLGTGGFRATGFFRTEQRDRRWWLVTPDGNGFFSIGMDVIALTGETYVDGREFMFRDLPPPNGELAAHWSEEDNRAGMWRAFNHGRAFNFYTANLQRKFGRDWRERWQEETVRRLVAWGFNTIGNWGEPKLWAMHSMPYSVPLWLDGKLWWGGTPDPFDPRFAPAVDQMARNAAAQFGSDPWLVGYFVDNELVGGLAGRPIRESITPLRSAHSAGAPRARRNWPSLRNSSRLITNQSASRRLGAFRSPLGMGYAARISSYRRRTSAIQR
jgi:hypothetical protein